MQTMRTMSMLFLLVAAAAPSALADQAASNPLGKVLELIDDLAAKVTKEGEAEQKAYDEYVEWCDDASKNAKFAIETATSQKAKLEAKIDESASAIQVCTSEIEKLASAISSGESELAGATSVREKEAADFAAAEKELMDAIDALDRAIKILEKEMAKNPASFAQVDTSNMKSALAGISVVLDAASFSLNDRKKLVALAQTQEESDEDDKMLGAPAAANYKSHSGGIFDVLEDMKDKADAELAGLRKAETTAKNNYEMLKQSLEAQLAADNKDMSEEKASKAAAEETKATATGDLERTVQELASSNEELATAQASCMTVAADHQTTVAARAEELKVIAEAKKILEETSAGAVAQTYSLLQISSRADLAKTEVVTMVKKLAQEHHSSALAQLASRLSAVAKYGGANGEDVFGKIKGLISDMIAKLEKEAEEEATEKAYCDEQMAKTEAKKSELEDDVAKMTAKIDQAASKSAELKEQIKELEGELASIAKEQAEMDKIRQEESAAYNTAKADLTLGLTGVRKALGVLRDYYGSSASLIQQPTPPEKHTKSGGAGSSIIGILEVCESDFASNLAKEEQQEADAASTYEKVTQENKVATSTKEQDVKYKTQEAKGLDKTIAEISADREAANTELSAVMEYYGKIKDRCIAKPETYEERKKRREAEIEGLKQALEVLENETAFLQKRRRHHMRGTLAAH
jgi:chromosome segregation ATPase